jgi:hypothetical protein
MAEQAPGEPPSRWTVINDYSKTVVTVCAALLAFIGAFSNRLSEGQMSGAGVWGLDGAVALLGLAALTSLAVPAMLDRYLRIVAKGAPPAPAPTQRNIDTATQEEWDSRKSKIWWTKCVANASYACLAFAIVGLAVFALFRPTESPKDEKTALAAAFNVVGQFANVSPSKLHAESLEYVKSGDSFELVLLDDTSNKKYKVLVPRGTSPASVHFSP